MKVLAVLSLWIPTFVIASTGCPTGCTCESDRISCTQLTSFPQPFVSKVKTLEIHMSELPEIPSNAFKDLPNAQFIHFQQVKIGTIKPCAFESVNTKASIEIDLTEIGTIEGGAFRNLQLKDFSMSSSIVGRIESFAFDTIRGLSLFQIHSTDIELVQYYAFHKFNSIGSFNVFDVHIMALQSDAFHDFTELTSMDLYHGTFKDLECKTLEKLRSQLGRYFSFHSLDVNCDCGIAWLLEASQSDSGLVLDNVICNAPPQLKDFHLTNLTRSDLCKGGSSPTCKSAPFNPPTNCNGDTETNASQRLVINYVQFCIILVLKHLLR